MGSTVRMGYPYPEDTDLVIQGDDAIQALAESVDGDMDWSQTVAHFLIGESPSSTGGIVNYENGSVSLMTGFTNDSGQITYTGPARRMFLACASVEVQNGGTDLSSVDSFVSIRQDGTAVAGSYDRLDSIDAGTVGTIQVRMVTHSVTALLLLNPGDLVDVYAVANPAGTIGKASFRVQPIGGFQ